MMLPILVALMIIMSVAVVAGFAPPIVGRMVGSSSQLTGQCIEKNQPYERRYNSSPTAVWASESAAVESESIASASTVATDVVHKLDGRKIRGIVQPCNNFILVKTADVIESTTGGIILTGKAKIRKTEGVVIAVGPGKTHQDSGIVIDMPVKIGDGVVYGKYDGTSIMYDDKPHTLIRDDDILLKYIDNDSSFDHVDVVHDHVLVRVDATNDEDATEGGILLAKTSSSDNKKASTGVVVKVGPGKIAANGQRIAMDVMVGDMIKFRDYAGNEVTMKDDPNDYTVVRMIDILAKY